jgi:predicted signal transduction protein with EAL and GGDEF domain
MLIDMRLVTLIVGEFVLLFASVLVFRSAWLLLDEYLGNSNLWLLLGIGIVLTVVGLVVVNYEVKCELQK